IFSVALLVMIISFSNLSAMQNRITERIQVQFLLEEAMEAVKNIRDNDWSVISGATAGAVYSLSFDEENGVFNLVSGTETIGLFDRQIVFENVSRGATGEIDEAGTNDAGTKKVTATISWPTGDPIYQKEISAYITDLFNE